MNQLAIDFSARTHARSNDPETSREAAARITEFASGHCGKILAALKKHGPQSPQQLAYLVGLNQFQVCRRLPELQKAGVAAPTGVLVETPSGRHERVWVALDKGQAHG